MNNDWAFLPMQSSTDLVGDAAALRERMDHDGYLYLPALLDPAKVDRVRARVLECLESCGWVKVNRFGRARCVIPPCREGDPQFFEAYDLVQRVQELHLLAHDEALVAVMADLLGGPVFPHPLKIARLIFPDSYETSTPPHQDFPNNQGTPSLTASWIPLHDLPGEMGGLAILRGSHRYGVLPLGGHLGPGNRYAMVPDEVQEQCRWVTTRYEQGDVLLFPSLTVHASTHNASEVLLRLSVDFRFQREGEALTDGCLEPHFQRLTWDEVYRDWTTTEHQYYWRQHPYEVVPFEEYPLSDAGAVDDEALLVEAHSFNRRQQARWERRTELLADDDAAAG